MLIVGLAQQTRMISKLCYKLGRLQKSGGHVWCQHEVKVISIPHRVVSVVRIRLLDAV